MSLAVPALSRHPHIAIVGPVPPPVTGRTIVTKHFVEALARSNASYTLVNVAVSAAGSPLRRKLRRAIYLTFYTFRVVRETRQATTTYIAVDGSPGTIFSALYALAARLAGTRLVLHHNSYSYVTKRTLGMHCLSRIAGPDALHVTPCATMATALRARYVRIGRTAVLSNIFAVEDVPEAAAADPHTGKLVLGHMSNLTVAKGVLTVIDCFAELYDRGEPVELHLAGPIRDGAVARGIRGATERFGPAFRYYGPVADTEKNAFFSSIQVFLLPTTYKNEVQPLVVLESLAAGVPVIAFGQCCIPSLLEDGCGLAIPCDHDFKAAAVEQVATWRRIDGALGAARGRARARFAQLRYLSVAELEALIGWLMMTQGITKFA